MNLWAKSLKQLLVLAVALFFFSCEEDTSAIGFKNPQKKFNVHFLEIPLETSVILLDSTITDNKSVPEGVSLVGMYNDNTTGNVKAESYLQMIPGFATKLASDMVFDSVTLDLRLNFYAYGLTQDRDEKFAVHVITEDSLNRTSDHSYRYNSTIGYNPEPEAIGSVHVDYDDFKRLYKQSNVHDSLAVVAKVRLTDDFGKYLMQVSKANDFKTREELRKFIYDVKGLALIPTETGAILGLDIYDDFSRVNLHYHSPLKDTVPLLSVFLFNPASFTNLAIDRAGTELAGLPAYQPFDLTSGNRYVQSGVPVATKIDLGNFYAFADTVENILISSAEIVIDGVAAPAGLLPHSSLRMRFLKEDNTFVNGRMIADRERFDRYSSAKEVLYTSRLVNNKVVYTYYNGIYYNISADNSTAAASLYSLLRYDDDDEQFSGYLTMFAQELYKKKTLDNRLQHLALVPDAPSIPRSVNRTVFHKDNIKLRIHYTRPTNNLND
ncbi:MAG TPA: DUF4270 family protein [Chryseosolibacter sp.]|nr:DUF4270 family protein [Chryseosolibacter sp.]